jgi:Predicted phosphoesterases, related to the Icc protein
VSRILFAGDTHGNLSHLRYLLEVAAKERVYTLFILGDFGYWEHQQEGVIFLDKLNAVAEKHGVVVYFLDGNHDNLGHLIDAYDGAEYLNQDGTIRIRDFITYTPRGLRWTWDGVRFIALGGAYSVDKDYRLLLERKRRKPGSLWFPGEEMTDAEMAEILADTSPVDIMLAHDKPAKTDVGLKNIPECFPNQHRLQAAMDTLKPKMYLHGHLHHRYSAQVPLPSLDLAECQVEGLGAEPDASWLPRYDAKASWIIVDLKEFAHARES